MESDTPKGETLRHRLKSVLSADVVGYSRLMELDEARTHSRYMNLLATVVKPLVAKHEGKIVKHTGDGFLTMFDNSRAALQCAKEMQIEVTKLEADEPPNCRIAFRMGMNIADVIVEDHDIFGDGVNIAARLQSYAEPGGIVISGAVREQIAGTLGMECVDLGLLHLRNLSHPVQVLSLRLPETGAASNAIGPGGYEGRASIAVLPFRNLAGQNENYFAQGMVDNIICALAALKELFVISRGSTLAFQGAGFDACSIGVQLGVRYVLSGSVLRSGNSLRINTELSDSATREIVRAGRYDGKLNDLFDLQDRIALESVKTIAPNVRERELKNSLRKHPQNMSAYDLFLQALVPLYELDYATFARARDLLQRAISLDPGYAPAYSHAAYWHIFRIGQEWSTDLTADINEAARLANFAIARDINDATALAIYGYVQSYLNKDFDAAIDFIDRALAISPNSALSWIFKGATLCFIGDGSAAVRSAEMGVRLSPLDQHIFFAEHILAQAHYINDNFDMAILIAQRADKRNARLTSNLRTLIACLVATDRLDEARDVAARHAKIVPTFRVSAWAARTPMQREIRDQRVKWLLAAGMPE